jgi:uncharacterized protein YprB with RNaseH-like and TPR domain
MRRDPEDLAGDGAAVAREYVRVLRGAREHFDELTASAGLCRVADAAPEEVLLCRVRPRQTDVRILLVGTLCVAGGRVRIEQHLARSIDEEPALLTRLADGLPQYAAMVTYKDRLSEPKRLADRAGAYGLTFPRPKGPPDNRFPPHLDLRAEVRKRWKGDLRGFSLVSVERSLCHRTPRHGLGRSFFDTWTDWRNSHDARALSASLVNNARDLLTMAQLLTFLLTGSDPRID